jgi:hypothetical protein
MTRVRALGCAALALVGTAVCVAVLLAASPESAASSPGGAGDELLPDLDLLHPFLLEAQVVPGSAGTRVLLAFASEAINVGQGPLLIRGHRAGLSTDTMAADQVIARRNGSEVVKQGVGHFEYVVDPTHQHWHLLPFMRYELRRAADFKLVVPDRKTGFCLGDRVDAFPTRTLPGEPSEPVYNTNCGPGQRDLLGLEEGISIGWGDVYERWRDGQYVDITGLAAGRYVLVHRVNVGRVLAESRYSNNAASVLIRITWPNGKQSLPKLTVLRLCAQTARCPAPRPH